jgi:16S rRNA (cytidine1402-2'-O)-methyltransferase
VILAEDTRVARERFRRQSVLTQLQGKIERFDAHREASENGCQTYLDRMAQGEEMALLSDAGMPGICDPGAKLVRECHQMGIEVQVIPGPSAVTTLVALSGYAGKGFRFHGFFPREDLDRKQVLAKVLERGGRGLEVWFESPSRILGTLQDLADASLGHKNFSFVLTLAKELTKPFERIWWGEPKVVLERVLQFTRTDEHASAGEWVFGWEWCLDRGAAEMKLRQSEKSVPWTKVLELLLESALPVSEAVRKVSEVSNVPKNEVYAEALRQKSEKAGSL